jgi:hypothetical protein
MDLTKLLYSAALSRGSNAYLSYSSNISRFFAKIS